MKGYVWYSVSLNYNLAVGNLDVFRVKWLNNIA